MLAVLVSKVSALPFCLTATRHLDYLGKDLPLISGKEEWQHNSDTHKTELSSWTHILGFAGLHYTKKERLI